MNKYLFMILAAGFLTVTSAFAQCGGGSDDYSKTKRAYVKKQRAYWKAVEKWRKKHDKNYAKAKTAKHKAQQAREKAAKEALGGIGKARKKSKKSKPDSELNNIILGLNGDIVDDSGKTKSCSRKSKKTKNPSDSFFNTRKIRR